MPRPTLVRAFLLLLVLAAPLAAPSAAQDASDLVFDGASVAVVHITIDPDSLQWVFDHPLSDREVPADFTFVRGGVTESVPNIGFRLRGNTSRAAEKRSFKVSFNTFESGRSWRGLEKLNLNGEHNDPTIARSALAWGLFGEAGAVASRAGHTEVYLNGDYYGLYLNVEHLDETFLQREFGTQGGALFKCLYPADLAYRGPTGASYQHTDGNGRPVYELSQGDPEAFDALARFIAVLNQTPSATFPAEIERVLDVNAFLRVLALDVALGQWDGYWYNQNNYYLRVEPVTERVTYIPYDYDNTFGIDWVGPDWGTRDPYTWGAGSGRPLVARLLAVPEFRARYTFYLRDLLTRVFTPERLHPRMDAMEALIADAAERDVWRTLDYGYTVADFHRAFDEPTGGHVEYGLKPYVTTRRATILAALDATNVPPILHRPDLLPLRPTPADDLTVTARVEDEAPLASVLLRTVVGAGSPVETAMRDDGTGGDAVAGDGVFTGVRAAIGQEATVAYAVQATDAVGQTRTTAVRTVEVRAPAAGLVVNEFLASNSGLFPDPAGDADDWVEIHNPTASPVSLLGYTLTDDLDAPDAWAFPDTTIAPGGFLVVWADDEPEQGAMHATFKLGASGESVGLFADGVAVDVHTFGPQTEDVAEGRSPDGTGAFVALATPTPGAPNAVPTSGDPGAPLASHSLRAYPNPFSSALTVELAGWPAGAEVAVFDVLGRRVLTLPVAAGASAVTWSGRDAGGVSVAAGLYVIRVVAGQEVAAVRVVRW